MNWRNERRLKRGSLEREMEQKNCSAQEGEKQEKQNLLMKALEHFGREDCKWRAIMIPEGVDMQGNF